MKVALVYNFARFTEWPRDAFAGEDDPLRIAVCGDQKWAGAFAELKDKTVGGRPIQVVFVASPRDAVGCRLLFLAKTERNQWPLIHTALAEDPVLTIGEMNGFLETGGILNLRLVNNRIRFDINLDNARAKHLVLSSQILKLASNVIKEKGQEN